MIRPLLLLLTLTLAAFAVDDHASPQGQEASNKRDRESASMQAAFKALQALHDAQLATKPVEAQSRPGGAPMSDADRKAGEAAVAWTRAINKAMTEYFAPMERRRANGNRDLENALASYPWAGVDAGPATAAGRLYGKAHGIDWLEDLCSGGAKFLGTKK